MSLQKVFVGLTLVVLLVAGCQNAQVVQPALAEPELTYMVSGCNETVEPDELHKWAKVEISVEDGVVKVSHNIGYVCCAEIQAELEIEDRVIKIIETNVGEVCRCMCGYELDAEIANLPAETYTVQVWGVQHQGYHSLELLGEAQVTL